MSRYHPLTVILHWLLALMIIVALAMGSTVIAGMDNADPEKLGLLANHRMVGLIILGLTVLRIVLRFVLPAPEHATTGNPVLDKLGLIMPKLLNFSVLFMAVSGFFLARQSGLGEALSGTAPLPETFFDFTPRIIHGILAKRIMALLALHVAGALYHQFILRDGLFSRLWFGKRD